MKKQLTDKEKNNLKRTIQTLQLPDNHVVLYCLANKESGTGLFSNQRLLLLHSREKSIRYYGKLPPGLLFSKEEDITQGKQKVFPKEVTDFKCYPMKGKTSTLVMEWSEGKNKVSWVYGLGSTKMMHEWIAAVDQMVQGVLNKDPTFISNQPANQVQPNPSQSQQQTSQQANQSQPPQQPPNQQGTPTFVLPPSNPQTNPQYGQVSQEIKALRNQQPDRFNLTNDLSKKQLIQPKAQNPPASNQTNPNNSRQAPADDVFKKQASTNKIAEPARAEKVQTTKTVQKVQKVQKVTKVQEKKQQIREEMEADRQRRQEAARRTQQAQTKQKVHNQRDNLGVHNQQSQQPNYKVQVRSEYGRQQANDPQTLTEYNHHSYPVSEQIKGSRSSLHDQSWDGNRKQLNKVKTSQQVGFNQADWNTDEHDKRTVQDGRVAQGRPGFKDRGGRTGPDGRSVTEDAVKRDFGKQKKNILQGKGGKKWNQIWCTSQDPLAVHEEFVEYCQNICTQIVDELPLLKSEHQFIPVQYQDPHYSYRVEGVIIDMHYFGSDQGGTVSQSKQKTPLLFDQESYFEAKRQFYNYNFILGMTGNKGLVKVPLTCLIEYKGVLLFCKAAVPESFDKVHPREYERQIQALQDHLKMRFIFNSLSLYQQPQSKYFLLWDLDELIPRMPVPIHPPIYFRKEFLLDNEVMIDNQQAVAVLHEAILAENIPDFLSRLESQELWLINSEDLLRQLHKAGLSVGNLPDLYSRTQFVFLKRIFSSQMIVESFSSILRSELNYMFNTFPAQEFQGMDINQINGIVMDCAHVLINELFSYSARSESIWKAIVREANRKYGVVTSKQDILPGFVLGGVLAANGIDCFYKSPDLNRDQEFFVGENMIPRNLLIRFVPKIRRYDLNTVSKLVGRVQEILSFEPTPENFEELVDCLDLKQVQIPSYCEPIKNDIRAYMCNFVPLGEHEQFQGMGIYDLLEWEPHNYCSTKVSLLAIKWAIKKRNEELANKIFEIKFEENAFWVTEFNPAISEFYDFFSIYNASIGNYVEAVKLAKSSLVNSIKLLGASALPTADKHYQLGNIFFKIGKKEEALKEYLKTKQILEDHNQTTIPEYAVILLKLTLLYLNFGKIGDCVGCGLQALKIFDANGGSEQDEIQTFEVLARAYEITRKAGDLSSVGALCSQKFNQTEDPKIFQRMVKIVLLPKLASLSPHDSKILLRIFSKLQELESSTSYIDSFNFLHRLSLKGPVMKKIFGYIDNIYELNEEVTRKDMLRKHKSLNQDTTSQASEMLVVLQAIACMVGYGFVIGSLRDTYYS